MTAIVAKQAAERRARFNAAEFFRRYGTFCIFLLLMIGAAYSSPVFLSYLNVMNVLRQISGVGIMAVGMLFVILTGGIDLSVGSLLAFGSVLLAIFIAAHSAPVSILLVILLGALAGSATGLLVAYIRMPSFVMTLAMMSMASGFALIISNGQPILMGDPGTPFMSFGAGFLAGIPDPVILMAAVYLAGGIVLSFTRFGRIVKAIGSNEEAVRLSGIAVPRYVASVYVISGALAAIAGIITTSRTGVGSASVGVGAELNVIAAVVIGGASLMGGHGGVINTLLGVLVLGIIGNIMNLANVPGYDQQVFLGLIIVVAMLLQYGTRRLKH